MWTAINVLLFLVMKKIAMGDHIQFNVASPPSFLFLFFLASFFGEASVPSVVPRNLYQGGRLEHFVLRHHFVSREHTIRRLRARVSEKKRGTV